MAELKGVSPTQQTIANEKGGMQSKAEYRFDLVDFDALLSLGEVLAIGAEKYAPDNWRLISSKEHFNHMLIHALAFFKGDAQDDHLGHMFCRAMMMYATGAEEQKGCAK